MAWWGEVHPKHARGFRAGQAPGKVAKGGGLNWAGFSPRGQLWRQTDLAILGRKPVSLGGILEIRNEREGGWIVPPFTEKEHRTSWEMTEKCSSDMFTRPQQVGWSSVKLEKGVRIGRRDVRVIGGGSHGVDDCTWQEESA